MLPPRPHFEKERKKKNGKKPCDCSLSDLFTKCIRVSIKRRPLRFNAFLLIFLAEKRKIFWQKIRKHTVLPLQM